MKLYFAPSACSFAPHISLFASGLTFETEKVDLRSKQTASGGNFLEVNPKGYVPTLVLDNGDVLTECAAILQYIADQTPGRTIAPAVGSAEHYHMLEWLTFISSEMHKGFGAFFRGKPDEPFMVALRDTLSKRLTHIDGHLKDHDFLVGDKFSVADAYLFTVLSWSPWVKIDLAPYANIGAYMARVGALPAVVAARGAEYPAA
jgi:glutathione S-transferase